MFPKDSLMIHSSGAVTEHCACFWVSQMQMQMERGMKLKLKLE